jgi:hypothetical protein
MATVEQTFWSAAWAWIKRIFRYIAAPLPALLLVVGAVILVILGAKDLQIGGLIGKLFGKDPASSKAVDISNTIPAHRIDSNGAIIPAGTPDSTGQTQAVVVPIATPNLFSNPNTVTVTPPNSAPVVISLPTGVTAKDVDKVVIVKPEVYAVTVKDSSSITGQHIDDLLKKYS